MSIFVVPDDKHFSSASSIDEKLEREKEDSEKQVYALPVDTFDDPNLDDDETDLEDDSPYPEVRSAVANTDDPDMPVCTIRAWTIGIVWSILIPGLNQFFFFRSPSITVTALVAQLLSFPVGRLWARIVPCVTIFGLPLNPGPFTMKEHVLITIMANVGYQSAYATDVVAVQRVYYNQIWSFSYQWMLMMSTQLIGFSIGGVFRRYLVQPPSMIWPTNLVTCALFNTLHSQQYAGIGNHGGLSRERFFTYAFIAGGCWYFFPGYIFQALSVFTWVCWIAPDNVVVNQLFGYESGLGMSLITFDWTQVIAYVGSPLATPWWAEANVAFGFVFFFWFLTPVLYYTNTWYAKNMPISSRTSYDNTGGAYNVSRIINDDATLNLTMYTNYSPLFLSTTFAVAYGLSFASITSTIVHTLLYFRKQIWVQSRRSLSEQPDIHARLMNRYPQVPDWWYGVVFVSMFTFAVISIEAWNTQFPVWALILALVISFIYTVPCDRVVTELIIGYALPGRPLAMMMFKTWGYISMYQALQFASDMKLGHYMKIPKIVLILLSPTSPRPMFWGQVVATVIAGTVQLGVQSWMFHNIPDMCTPNQKDGFVCPSTEVFGTASIVWGVIGPSRQFTSGQIYHGLVFFFLVGAFCPLISYFFSMRWPNSILKYVNFPVIFNGPTQIPPATAVNYVPWTIVGFIFNYVIRRRHFSWWTKYNYILSAAMDSGVAVAIILIYFCLQYPQNGTIGQNTIQTWWGNTVFKNTADYNYTSYYRTNGTFGPKHW
ncbi:hypothetical protein POSPLADRAFT_1066013 [Postia placenta MAD-698-R-SB12]|uniref:OPT oligopeptide transporter n=1 Tax=Postia placenta MAD-698-R-SB12 TaxID=670580 RepID=A0A1X6N383_9APHY|nr:hypothetical protein POSPLADRAFT_1066013 [Postia placenta MAD-698-R-SB12]OSX63077.1 hypothetical protein POSPLADRAFT_1066013 [Postia placenta MAD-698-R-SB12]